MLHAEKQDRRAWGRGYTNRSFETLKETDRLASKPLDQWSTYAANVSKCTTGEDGSTVYERQKLKKVF